MKAKTRHYTVANGAVRLAVSEAGQGQTLLFVNGGGATQVVWRNIIAALAGSYRMVTFDLRNHGASTNARDTSLDAFQSDLEAIMDHVVGDRPIMVGWSLGADLAVLYAAAHPGRVAGLFLIDGAAPVNLTVSPEDTRRRLNTPAMRFGPRLMDLVGRGYRLSPEEFAVMVIDVNARREQLPAAYDTLDCPVNLMIATMSAGKEGERAARNNAAWRAGVEKLAHDHPEIAIQWMDNRTHLFPLKEPVTVARSLDTFVQRVKDNGQGQTQQEPAMREGVHLS